MDATEHRRQMWRLRKRRQKDREQAGRAVLHVGIEDPRYSPSPNNWQAGGAKDSRHLRKPFAPAGTRTVMIRSADPTRRQGSALTCSWSTNREVTIGVVRYTRGLMHVNRTD